MNKVFSLVVALFAIYFITVSVRSDIILPPPGGGGGSGSGSITNLPSYALTNNQSSQVTLLGGQTNSGKLDIGGAGFFTGNITSKTTTARMVVEGTISAGVRIAQGANVISFDTTAGPNISSVDGANGDQFMLWNGSVISLITSPTGTVSYGHFFTPSNATAANFVATADDAYAAGWNGSLGIPTKNALYDKIETLGGGSGGTNFPNVNLLPYTTNAALTAGIYKSFVALNSSNFNLNFDLAAPVSGQAVDVLVTNVATTNITITFRTNGIAGIFYDIEEKTNSNTSWSVPAGGMTYSKFVYMGWPVNWVRVLHSAPSLVFAVDTTYYTMTTGGVNNLTTTLSPAYTPMREPTIAKFATNAAWNINVPLGGSVNAITNTLGGSTANLWITNVVDGGFFVARTLVDSSSRLISVTNASGLTLKVISTNGFAVLTLPQVYVAASKVATIMGRAWVIAGTTNVDLWANVEQ